MGSLRILLAISVVVYHTGPFLGLRLVDGITAVQAFFVLSGFYMSLVLETRYREPGAWRAFLANRAWRLFPTYLLVAGATVAIGIWGWMQGRSGYNLHFLLAHFSEMDSMAQAYALISNLTLIGLDWAYFLRLHEGTLGLMAMPDGSLPQVHSFAVVPVAWTLGVELTFYLCAPWLLRRSSRALALTLLASLALRAALHQAGFTGETWAYRFFPCELAWFLAGALAHRIWRSHGHRLPAPVLCRQAFWVLLALALVFPLLPPVLARYGFVCACAAAAPLLFHGSKPKGRDAFLAELTYPLYLSHSLAVNVLSFMDAYDARFAVPAALACAAVLTLGFERPLGVWRRRRGERPNLKKGRRESGGDGAVEAVAPQVALGVAASGVPSTALSDKASGISASSSPSESSSPA